MSHLSRLVVAGLLAFTLGPALAAEPPFTISEDGATFFYRARPGDQPGSVAAMFGIGSAELPAFLATNRITDPTRVGIGYLYKVPNPLAARAASAEEHAKGLSDEVGRLRAREAALTGDLATAREEADGAVDHAARLAWYERMWTLIVLGAAVLLLVAAAACAFAFTSIRNARDGAAYVLTLAGELDEKRRAALAERQESAKRILDLETKVRELETKVTAANARQRPAGAA